jgi:hypothetical protein
VGVHTAPTSSADVPDETTCRLVILAPSNPHESKSDNSKAIKAVKEIFENRGTSPRIYRNMLVFLAPDIDRLHELSMATRAWLAWVSIKQDEDQLNLDVHQRRQADKQIRNFEETIQSRILETYQTMIIPIQDSTNPVAWSTSKITGEGLVDRVSKKLKTEGQLVTEWAPALLRMELDKWLWKDSDHINIKQLWDYLAQYPYLSRLKNDEVLLKSIRDGVGSFSWEEYFGYASAFANGEYKGIINGSVPSAVIDGQSLLVKPEIIKQIRQAEVNNKETGYHTGLEDQTTSGTSQTNVGSLVAPEIEHRPKAKMLQRFYATVSIDSTRMASSAGKIAEEVIAHLSGLMGAEVNITMEISIEVPNGIPEDKIRIVNENCNTLKFSAHHFEE